MFLLINIINSNKTYVHHSEQRVSIRLSTKYLPNKTSLLLSEKRTFLKYGTRESVRCFIIRIEIAIDSTIFLTLETKGELLWVMVKRLN